MGRVKDLKYILYDLCIRHELKKNSVKLCVGNTIVYDIQDTHDIALLSHSEFCVWAARK